MDTMDSSGLYLDITEFAHDTPGWVQHIAEVWTELGLLLFGALFVVAWWRARRGDSRAFAVAVLAPLGTALAYVISEAAKSVVDEERPCRAVKGALTPLVECPPHGDWSFPSNHSTIAGAAAVGLALAWPRIAAFTLPMAVLMAFSRVFVGVHYPHDVAVGLVLGAVVAFLVVRLATRPVARVAETMRGSRAALVTWFAGPGPATAHASGPSAAPAPAYAASTSYDTPSPYGASSAYDASPTYAPYSPYADGAQATPHAAAHSDATHAPYGDASPYAYGNGAQASYDPQAPYGEAAYPAQSADPYVPRPQQGDYQQGGYYQGDYQQPPTHRP